MTVTLTADERALLRSVHADIGLLIAAPAYAIEGWRSGSRSGGGGGFRFDFGTTRITGEWWEWHAVKWRADGTPWQWDTGELLRAVTITYARLHRWVESLPAGIRAQADIWSRTYPEDTSDRAQLARLVADVLADPEPVDLLELLAATT